MAEAQAADAVAPEAKAADAEVPQAKVTPAKTIPAKTTQAKVTPAKLSKVKTAGVFEALGEPVRRRILELLADGERPVGPLVVALRSSAPISQPAVSQHLKVLLDAGLVSVRAAGTRRLYALDTGGLDAVRAWLDRLADPLAPFAQPLDALATEVARGRRASRSGRAKQGDQPSTAPGAVPIEEAASPIEQAAVPAGEEPRGGQDRRPA